MPLAGGAGGGLGAAAGVNDTPAREEQREGREGYIYVYVRIVTCFLGCSLSDGHGIAALVQHVLNFVQGDEVGGAGEGDLWGV